MYRDGLIIWTDLKSGQQWSWGNTQLADEKFRPGSLMKLLTAQAAYDQADKFRYRCGGHEGKKPKRRFCWKSNGHGSMDLPKALAHSCNLFFAQLGKSLSRAQLLTTLSLFNFSFQGQLEKQKALDAHDWGDVVIGDSPHFLVSPQEMGHYWNQFIQSLSAGKYPAIAQVLLLAAREGTASGATDLPANLWAKTGTADSEGAAFKTHGWFLGAYPAGQARYTLVIFLKNAHGFAEPTRLASEIFSLVLERKGGTQ